MFINQSIGEIIDDALHPVSHFLTLRSEDSDTFLQNIAPGYVVTILLKARRIFCDSADFDAEPSVVC